MARAGGIAPLVVIVAVLLAARASAVELASLHTHRMEAELHEGERVYLRTCFGAIPIRLLPENAPEAVAKVKALASSGSCENCAFYRAEARPSPTEAAGPPYGLLQGRLAFGKTAAGEPNQPKPEGTLPVRTRGVASLPGTDDFFISLVDHGDWGSSHVVWGELEDWFATDMIAAQRFSDFTHPEHGTHMRMLLEEFPFSIGDELRRPPA